MRRAGTHFHQYQLQLARALPAMCCLALGANLSALAQSDESIKGADPPGATASSPLTKGPSAPSEEPVISSGIPAEFLDLIEPELTASAGTLIVDVYVDGAIRASTILQPIEQSYLLATPEDVTLAINDLVDADAFTNAISVPLSESTESLCIVGSDQTCFSPTEQQNGPEVLSMILDISNLRLDIYRPGSQKSQPPPLAPSHPQHTGVISSFRAQMSGRNVSGNSDIDGALSYRLLAGRGRNSAFADGAIRSTGELNVRRFGIQRFQGERRYSAGVIQSGGSQLSAQTRIIGFEAERIQSLQARQDDAASQPLVLFIPKRALVTIQRDGEQLYSNFLDSGPQAIDTRLFPGGAYNLDIEITPDGEAPYRETRFFANTSGRDRSVQWRLSAGVAQRQRNDIGQLTSDDETENELTANLTMSGPGPMGSWLSGQVGVNGGFAFAELGTSQVWRSISLNTAGRISNSGYSANFQAQGSIRQVALSTNARFSEGLAQAGFGTANSSTRRLLLSATASAPIAGFQLNGFARVAKVENQEENSAIGLRASRSIQLGRTNLLVSGSIQQSGDSTSGGVRISVGRQIPNATVRGFANVRAGNRNDEFEISSRDYGADARYRFNNRGLGNPNLSLRVLGDESGLTNLSSSVTSQTSLLNSRARVQNSFKGDRATTFSGSLDTSVAISAAGIGLSAKNSVDGGVMVRQSKDSGAKITASAVGADRFTIGKQARFIPTRSFTPTRVKFRPARGESAEVKSNSPELLLFPGNIVPIEAEVVIQVSVFGQVVDDSGVPLSNAYLRSGGVDFLSDDSGYFVADLPVKSDKIEHIRDGAPECSFDVSLSREDNVKGLGRMICRSQF